MTAVYHTRVSKKEFFVRKKKSLPILFTSPQTGDSCWSRKAYGVVRAKIEFPCDGYLAPVPRTYPLVLLVLYVLAEYGAKL